MNASLSLSRFGVSSRISRARSRVWSGGSIVTMCSCIGSWSRYSVDDLAHVVALERHRERRRTDRSPSCTTRSVSVSLVDLARPRRSRSPRPRRGGGAGAPGTADAQLVEVRVRVLDQRLVGEVVDRLPVAQRVSSVRRAAVHSHSNAGQLLSIRAAAWQGVGVATAASPRRIGAEDSKTRAQLLDAAELLLLEEGYAAVTSRRVAAKAGLKPQLVHYYFRTMDDLFLEVFRRRAEENLARFERAVAADGVAASAVAAQRRSARRRVHDRVRRAGEPPQGDPRRDRPLRRAVPRRPARGADAPRSRRPASPTSRCRRSSPCS